MIDGNGRECALKKYPENDAEIRKALWYRNPLTHSAVMFRRECYEEYAGYNEDFLYAEDLELWIRFGQTYRFHNIQENLLRYRVHMENSIFTNQTLMIRNSIRARKKTQELGYDP